MTTSLPNNGEATPRKRGGALGIYLTPRERDKDASLTWAALALSSIGQGVVWSPLMGKGLFATVILVVLMIPFFIVFTLNFTNRPPLSPRASFRCWLFASCLNAVITIGGEIFYRLGYLPIITKFHTSEDYYIPRALHVVMYVGFLSFIPLLRYFKFCRDNGHAL